MINAFSFTTVYINEEINNLDTYCYIILILREKLSDVFIL